jgi:hypothetical protein
LVGNSNILWLRSHRLDSGAIIAATKCGLTTRSTGPATAGSVSLVRGTWCIISYQAYAACLRGPVSSNVRPHQTDNASCRRTAKTPRERSQRMLTSLLYPMAAHVALAALVYVLLTFARAPSVWGVGKASDGSNPWAQVERRISANLSNQFEWPLFFYAACLVLLQLGAADTVQTWFAWLFVIGRVAHSFVHIFTTNVRLRGIVFTINFLAVLAMWCRLFAAQVGGAQ